MSQLTDRLFDMADTNSDPRPPVLVEINVSWPGFDGQHNETIEVSRDKWDAMTWYERTQYCETLAEETAADMVGWGWHIPDQDDYATTEEPK
jgi:hypothetical protein